ncbi:hypothetical protein [Halorubrum ezzemoulense]|uniref:hypothetical protein n=1 Tax=Halorubrum ezzemoulense TaxID=337243 RepID=UPI00232C530D|nr:hypothetical protein [Halorubrum ezzemoulense]MDB2240013.1 hypothetical protein [Halorubrum ezzemoulense]
MAITLAAAKRAKEEARRKAGNYATTRKNSTNRDHQYYRWRRPTEHEPADPTNADHESRRQTRLAPADYEGLTKPFYECGCGECTDTVDPLAADTAAFRDVLMAADVCPNPRPVTVEKAREIYLAYQHASWQSTERTSELERTQSRTGRMLGAERHILSEMDDPTLLFLSLRLSPIEENDGRRRWIPPATLADRLGDAWQNVRSVLNYQLREYDSEYATITAMTTSAATPHRHAAVYVDDPDDEVGIEVAESAVESHVNNCKGAHPEYHPVNPGERDAGEVFHDIPKAEDVSDDTLTDVFHARGTQPFTLPSVPLYYMANQQPHWALKNVYDGASDVHNDSIEVDGAAIAWALPWRQYSSSKNFADRAVQE